MIAMLALALLMAGPAHAYVDDDGGGRADPSGDGDAPGNDGGGLTGTFTAPDGSTHTVRDFTPRGGGGSGGGSGDMDGGSNGGNPEGRDPTDSD